MQDAINLLRAVLPAEGKYACRLVGRNFRRGDRANNWFNNVEDLARFILDRNQYEGAPGFGPTPYFVTCSFKPEAPDCTRDYILYSQELRVDIDWRADNNPKHYQDQCELLEGFDAAMEQLGWPDPWIVETGGGYHMHWPLDAPMAPGEIEGYQRAFQQALVGAGVKIDAEGAVHPSHILRLPGTFHKGKWEGWGEDQTWKAKDPFQVRLIQSSVPSPISAFKLTPVHVRTSRKAKIKPGLTARIAAHDPVEAMPVINGCRQMQAVLAMAMQEPPLHIDEPVFYSIVGPMHGMILGEELARWMAGRDPEGRRALDFEAKWAARDNKSCEYIERCRPGGCDGCPARGEFWTPLQWANQKPQGSSPASSSAPDPTPASAILPGSGHLYPGGYSLNEKGQLVYVDPSASDQNKFEVVVCHHPLEIERELETQFTKSRKIVLAQHGPKLLRVELDVAAVFRQGGTAELQGMGFRIGNDNAFREFTKASLGEIKHTRFAYDQMGWTEGHEGFVLGRKLYTRNGVEDCEATPALSKMADGCVPSGDLETWKRMMQAFHADRVPHRFMFLMGVSSPLMQFRLTKQAGGCIGHASSGEGDSGKTTAQKIAAGVFGCPTVFILDPMATVAGRAGFFAQARHLPIMAEEIKIASEPELAIEVIKTWTAGAPKRITVDSKTGHSEQRPGNWCANLLSNANRAFTAVLQADPSAQAQMGRVFDVRFPELKIKGETGIAKAADNVYGVAGPLFIQELVRLGPKAINETLETVEQSIAKRYPDLDERFQVPMLAAMWFTNELLQQMRLIPRWEFEPILQLGARTVEAQLFAGTAGKLRPIQLLKVFIQENMRFLFIDGITTNFIQNVYGRVIKGDDMLWIEKRKLRMFVTGHSGVWEHFVDVMRDCGVFVREDSIVLGSSDIPFTCFGFSLKAISRVSDETGVRVDAVLHAASSPEGRGEVRQLRPFASQPRRS